MKKILAVVLAALMLTCVLASCANGMGDKNAINDYTPEVMYISNEQGVFTFANGEGDTAILVSYAGKATKDDHVVIPEKFNDRVVVGIGDGAFYHLASIVEVTIPETVTSIGAYAFADCTELPSIHLPAGLESIGEMAFAGCTKLETVNFGSSLLKIDDFAFYGCTALKAADLPATTETIGNGAFWCCKGLTSFAVPASLTTIGKLCFYDCTGLQTIKLSDKLTEIGSFAFVTETSTLKDKIDTTSFSADSYTGKYVAEIAEPTVEETTEAENDAE